MVTAAEIRLEKFKKLKAEREKLELANKVLRGELVDRGVIEAILWGGAQNLKEIINGWTHRNREEKEAMFRSIAGIKIRVVTAESVNGQELNNEVAAKKEQRKRGRPKGSKTKVTAPA